MTHPRRYIGRTMKTKRSNTGFGIADTRHKIARRDTREAVEMQVGTLLPIILPIDPNSIPKEKRPLAA